MHGYDVKAVVKATKKYCSDQNHSSFWVVFGMAAGSAHTYMPAKVFPEKLSFMHTLLHSVTEFTCFVPELVAGRASFSLT